MEEQTDPCKSYSPAYKSDNRLMEKTMLCIFKLLPGADRMEFSLEKLEDKRQEVSVKLQQRWQSRSREWVTGDSTGQAVTEGGHTHKNKRNARERYFALIHFISCLLLVNCTTFIVNEVLCI